MTSFFVVSVSRGTAARRFGAETVGDILDALALFDDREQIDLLRVERIEPLVVCQDGPEEGTHRESE